MGAEPAGWCGGARPESLRAVRGATRTHTQLAPHTHTDKDAQHAQKAACLAALSPTIKATSQPNKQLMHGTAVLVHLHDHDHKQTHISHQSTQNKRAYTEHGGRTNQTQHNQQQAGWCATTKQTQGKHTAAATPATTCAVHAPPRPRKNEGLKGGGQLTTTATRTGRHMCVRRRQ